MTASTTSTLNTGSFRGRCYRHVRVTKPHTKSQVWWVLDDGNYFKSLDSLIRHVTASKPADDAARIACERGETTDCPEQHLCRHGIDN
jgi:hypothetical protein